ncbi:CDP-glycerol glycerophosphotransferase family protein [Ligilactobacillus agilis]|nr:CDP-glycerol glycerophosphotransferase family protein [Ligilactobacillus agilis]
MNIIAKIKKNGLVWLFNTLMNKVIVKCNTVVYYVCRLIPINDKKVIFESEGDLSDNSFALYEYMLQHNYLDKYEVIWAVNNLKEAKLNNYPHTKFVNRFDNILDIKRSFHLATAKYFVYDHYNLMWYLKKRKEQIILNLWHGVGYKAIKNGNDTANIKTQFDYFDSLSDDISLEFLKEFLNCSPQKGVVLGYPRLDYFFKQNLTARKYIKKIAGNTKVLLWMPTFRQSINPELSEEYADSETGLPIVYTSKNIEELNNYLHKKEVTLILKMHHLQAELNVFKKKYTNIKFISDEELRDNNIQLYQFVAETDALITDYSSIAIDYLLLDKPIIFTLDDYDDYKKSRGFYKDNIKELMPGYHIYNYDEFIKAISEASSERDLYSEERYKVLPMYHKFRDGNSSRRVLEFLNIER